MATERLTTTTLFRTLADVAADVSDLMHKEFQLAKAELASNIAAKLRGGLWFVVAATFMILALLLALQAAVLGISSYGIPIHWSSLIVAGAAALLGAVAFVAGRATADRPFVPERTIHQLQQDVTLGKEQFT